MSSKSNKEDIQDIIKEHLSERPLDMKEISIPFRSIVSHGIPIYIYSGDEKIPFKKRHPEYQVIFRDEFRGELQRFFEEINQF